MKPPGTTDQPPGDAGDDDPSDLIAYQQLRRVVEKITELWRRHEAPDAAAALSQHPELHRFPSLAVAVVYEEYRLRRDRGESVEIAAYGDQYPALRSLLLDHVRVEQYLHRLSEDLPDEDELPWPEPGDLLFDFRVESQLAAGASSRVYLGTQRDLGGRPIVVKITQSDLTEAEALGRMNHPNIMPVYAVHEDPQSRRTVICMPFVGRSTLLDVIETGFQQGQLPRQAACILDAARRRIQPGDRYHAMVPTATIAPDASYVQGVVVLAIQIAESLHHAHQRGVLHGDVKPTNVVLSTDAVPMLVDFNLAFGHPLLPLLRGWTPPYTAPEQIRALLLGLDARTRVDERADLFAFGVTLYQLLTGRIPFEVDPCESDPELLACSLLDAQAASFQPVDRLNPEVDRGLATLVGDCLRFDPKQRPASMADVADRLRGSQSPLRRVRALVRRRPAGSLAAVIAIVTLSVAAALYCTTRPTTRDRYYDLGSEKFQQSHYLEAADAFGRSLAADGNFAEAYLGRAAANVHLFDRDRSPVLLDVAIRDLQACMQLRNDVQTDIAKAFCYTQKRDFRIAADLYEKALERCGNLAEVWNNLGYCHCMRTSDLIRDPVEYAERVREADLAVRRAIELDPNLWQAHLNLALLELERFRNTQQQQYIPRDGLNAMRRVIQLNPNDSATFYFAAKLAGIVGDSDRAPALMEECLDYLEEACKRGHIMRQHGDPQGYPFSLFENDPRFQALLRDKPSSRVATAAQRLIMPSLLASARFSETTNAP